MPKTQVRAIPSERTGMRRSYTNFKGQVGAPAPFGSSGISREEVKERVLGSITGSKHMKMSLNVIETCPRRMVSCRVVEKLAKLERKDM